MSFRTAMIKRWERAKYKLLRYHPDRIRFFFCGRNIICHRCHQSLGKVQVLIRDGKVVVNRLEEEVYVDFDRKDTLRFRHMQVSCCRVPEGKPGNEV